MRIKFLSELLNNLRFSDDNLHLIAISNLDRYERKVIRYWCRKYKVPEKPLGDHTIEELVIEMLEDYYERNPKEAEKVLQSVNNVDAHWDGTMPVEYENKWSRFWKKKRPVDLKRYQSDKELTPEEEKLMLENLGKNLPGSIKARNEVIKDSKGEKIALLGDGEFDDVY